MIYLVTSSLVLVGVFVGLDLVASHFAVPLFTELPSSGNRLLDTLTRWDGQWYLTIATQGYQYDPDRQSSVAFFPAYPAIVDVLHESAHIPIQAAGLIVSHTFLIGAIALLFLYVLNRSAHAPAQIAAYAVFACALFPTGFFMRMAYTESLFLFLSLLTFLGMARMWPLAVLAAIVGTATGTRSTGVALFVAMAHHVWERSDTWRCRFGRLAYLLPLATWGLLAYIAFQWWAFGEPFAFVKTQQHWRMRPPSDLSESLPAMLTCEPIWCVYRPSMPGYYGAIDRGVPLLISYQAANPAVFVLGIALVLLGAVKKWLSAREVVFGALLLGIPYAMAGYRWCMASQGRYVSVVFPIYIVLGHLLYRMPVVARIGLLGVSAAYLMIYSALLAAGYFTV